MLPLPTIVGDGVGLRLANEARETRMTDRLEFWLVDHVPALRSVSTVAAAPVLVGPPSSPTRAVDRVGTDTTQALVATDDVLWQSDLEQAAEVEDPELRDGVIVEFPYPRTRMLATHLVLEVRAGNMPWLDLVFGRFFALLGPSLG